MNSKYNSLKMNSMLMIALTAAVFSCIYTGVFSGCIGKWCSERPEVCIYEGPPLNACYLPPLDVTYDKKYKCGQKILWSNVFNTAPTVRWSGAKKDSLYTLIIIRPVHWNKKFKTLLHWGISNIKGAALKKGVSSSRNFLLLAGYTPPVIESGRNQVFIYKQNSSMPIPQELNLLDRVSEAGESMGEWLILNSIPVSTCIKIDMQDLASKLQLCGPLAGFQLQFE